MRRAVYERSLPVSEARVWENVHDWEHLPWLHRTSFRSIELEEKGSWGWRARIGLPGDAAIRLELVIEADEPRYVSRTLEGPGAGNEIWTRVTTRGAERTDVVVELWTPPLPDEAAAAMGDLFVGLYTQLWDEDEAMMLARGAALERPDAPSSGTDALDLGPLDVLRSKLPLVVEFGSGRRRFRVVDLGGELVAHSAVCPHWLGPLDEAAVEHGRVECPWHGYAFDVRTGQECSGRRLRLTAPPRVRIDATTGHVFVEPA